MEITIKIFVKQPPDKQPLANINNVFSINLAKQIID